MYRLRQSDDLDLIRELHGLAMPADAWPGDDHTFWLATDEGGEPVGFCSAIYRVRPDIGDYVFLSRAAVMCRANGQGLQRRMIRARVQWARALGAPSVLTYTLLKNYSSFVNLLACGFRFYEPPVPYVGYDVHYLKLDLTRS